MSRWQRNLPQTHPFLRVSQSGESRNNVGMNDGSGEMQLWSSSSQLHVLNHGPTLGNVVSHQPVDCRRTERQLRPLESTLLSESTRLETRAPLYRFPWQHLPVPLSTRITQHVIHDDAASIPRSESGHCPTG